MQLTGLHGAVNEVFSGFLTGRRQLGRSQYQISEGLRQVNNYSSDDNFNNALVTPLLQRRSTQAQQRAFADLRSKAASTQRLVRLKR